MEFDFDTVLPPHFRPEEGDLTVEEEYDALNDETFGDGADWDEDNMKTEEFSGISGEKADLSDDGVALEASISQLVDDDDDIHRSKTESAAFGRTFRRPSPPPPLFGSDISGSPIRKSIWASDDMPRIKPPPGLGGMTISQKLIAATKKVKTLEELERDLLAENQEVSVNGQQKAPPLHKIRSAEELEKELLGGDSQPRLPGMPLMAAHRPIVPQQPPPMMPYPPDILRQLGGAPEQLPNRMMLPGAPGMMPFPRGFPPPHMVPPPMHLLHQQQLMNQQYQKTLHEQGRQGNQRQRYDSFGYDDYNEEDEYEGLMSRREKQWLINLINTQHVSDNPYVDDYYNTVYRMRQLKRLREQEHREAQKTDEPQENGNQVVQSEDAGRVILPDSKNRMESRNYAPTQFANSLGKLQCLTVAAPRRLIDVDMSAAVAVHETTGQKEARRHKQLLLDIERLFANVFALEDWNKLVEVPLAGNTAHHEQLSAALANPERLISIMSLRKGKNLIARACSFLPAELRNRILSTVFANLELFRRDHSDPMVARLATMLSEEILKCTDLESVLKIAENIKSNSSLTGVIANKVGCNICLTIVTKGDALLATEKDNTKITRWNTFVTDVFHHLSSLRDKNVSLSLNSDAFTRAGVSPSKVDELVKRFSRL